MSAIAYTIPQVGGTSLVAPVLAGGITNSAITVDVARPYSLTTMDVATGLTYDAINRKLELESVLDSVFVDISAVTMPNPNGKIMVPDACIMKLSGEQSAKSQVLVLENPLTGPGRGGSSEAMMGFERQATLEYMKVFYNEYSQGVIGETWGKAYNELEAFKYYAGEQPRLSRWFAEDLDKQYHQALLETIAWPLNKVGGSGAAGSAAKDYALNPNWFIANLDPASQPTYDETLATFQANLATAFQAADTGTSGVNANIDLDYLIYLDQYARNQKKIRPVTIGGKPSYIVLIPTPQYYKLLRTATGQLGSVWQSVSALTKEEQAFPGIVGRVMSLVLVEDTRYPTLKSTNAYGDNLYTIEYVEPGNDDARNKAIYASATNAAWDIGFLMGAGAIVDWTAKPLHFEMEKTEYGKKYGKAAFTERGIQLGASYDTDTVASLNKKNFGSIVLAFTATTLAITA